MQKWLYGILALTMMVQAIVTVAYVHHSELTGAEYVSFDHDGESSVFLSQSGSEESDKSPVDDFSCHHCCHCIGIFMPLVKGAFKTVISTEKLFGYSLKLPSASISPHLRPPIL